MQKRTTEELDQLSRYWAEAQRFVAHLQIGDEAPWHALSLRSGEELWAWAAYFKQRIGFLPRMFQMLEEHKIQEVLVPSRWPEWFDRTWSRPQTLSPWPDQGKDSDWTPEAAARVRRSADDAIRQLGGGVLKAFPNDDSKRRKREAEARESEQIINSLRPPVSPAEVPITPELQELVHTQVKQ